MRRTLWKEKAVRLMFVSAATTSILVVALIFLFVGREAAPLAANPGLDKLIGTKWAPTSARRPSFGMGPLVSGSLVVTAIATLVVIPFGSAARSTSRKWLAG